MAKSDARQRQTQPCQHASSTGCWIRPADGRRLPPPPRLATHPPVSTQGEWRAAAGVAWRWAENLEPRAEGRCSESSADAALAPPCERRPRYQWVALWFVVLSRLSALGRRVSSGCCRRRGSSQVLVLVLVLCAGICERGCLLGRVYKCGLGDPLFLVVLRRGVCFCDLLSFLYLSGCLSTCDYLCGILLADIDWLRAIAVSPYDTVRNRPCVSDPAF